MTLRRDFLNDRHRKNLVDIMTLTEFLELTKDAYGGDVISKMKEVE